MSSTTTFTASVFEAMSRMPAPCGPITAPTNTKTMGAVIDHRSSRAARSE